jgi:hypothetical protein
MNSNGHTEAYRNLERIVDYLRRRGNRQPLRTVVKANRCGGIRRADIEEELAKANCPLGLEFDYSFSKNGPPKEWLVLKNPGWCRPVMTQQAAASRLNGLSREEWLNLLDPTRELRLSNKRGHRRTSTGAAEYLNGHSVS